MQQALTTQENDALFEGITLGRTLHQLEKVLGIKAERLLHLIRHDENTSMAFKEAREISAYVIEDEVTEKLRKNAAEPASAVQNNALKLWADHMHWVAERRNAAIYSGKAPVNVSVPIQIVTSLDLGQQKSIDGVYELTAEIVEEVPAADILSTGPPVPPPAAERTPFSRLLAPPGTDEGGSAQAEGAQEPAQAEIRAGQATSHSGMGKKTRGRPPVVRNSEAPTLSGAPSRKKRERADRKPASDAPVEGQTS